LTLDTWESVVCGFRERAISAHNAITTSPNPNTPTGNRNNQAVPVTAANHGQWR
jgi:hypothetical protein